MKDSDDKAERPKPLTDEERAKVDAVTLYETIRGQLTIFRYRPARFRKEEVGAARALGCER